MNKYNAKEVTKDLMSAFLEMTDAYEAAGQATAKKWDGKALDETSYSIVFKDVAIRLTIGCNSVYFAKIEESNNDKAWMASSEDNIIYAIISVLNAYIGNNAPEAVINAK